MPRPQNSDEYLATITALGPGLAACALMGTMEFAVSEFVPLRLMLAYSAALLAFLPGLPFLGFCLAWASGEETRRIRLAGLLVSLVAPIWHIALIDIIFRSLQGQFPVNWPFVARYDACLWLTTAGFWASWVRRRPDPRPES